jgi:flagellar assembly protein FliH
MTTRRRTSDVLRGTAESAQPRRLTLPRRKDARNADASTRGDVASTPAAAAMPIVHSPTTSPAPLSAAFDQAREDGLRQGLQDAQAQFEQALRAKVRELEDATARHAADVQARLESEQRRLAMLATSFGAAVDRRLDLLEEDAIQLAYSAVCRILGEQRGTREGVLRLVHAAISQLRGRRLLRVRLHPADLQSLHVAGDESKARWPQVDWIGDDAVEAGGCLLDTDAGTLDARLETQLAELLDLWSRKPGTEAPQR